MIEDGRKDGRTDRQTRNGQKHDHEAEILNISEKLKKKPELEPPQGPNYSVHSISLLRKFLIGKCKLSNFRNSFSQYPVSWRMNVPKHVLLSFYILRFPCSVDEVFVFLGCHAALIVS
jgi:hypothetical protein